MRNLGRFFLMTVAVLPAWAAGLDDPFATDEMLPLKPAPSLTARVGEAPCSTALPATPLTAIDAVDLMLCNHPQTREVWAAARVQAALVGVAKAGWLPTLSGSAGRTRFEYQNKVYTQDTAAITLSWLLYDFGQRSANVENAQQLLGAAAATQDATVQTLFLAALQAYYSAQAMQAAVTSALQAERSARESYQAAEARYSVGVATPADRLQAQTALSQATLNRIKAEGDARNALGSLANALGFAAQQPIVLADMPAAPAVLVFQKEVDALITEALARRPDLRAAEAQLKAAQASVDLARAQGRPTLSLTAGPTWQDSAGMNQQGGAIGLALNVPIFSGFDTTYRVRSASAQVEVREAQRDRIRSQVAFDVWKAYQSLTTATQSLQTTADLVAS
ncbi:MAG: TolC family protein, partial [Betaproteobacteria bacterium]|nr:TolC family protein [Betaproteobacteria bacterium]